MIGFLQRIDPLVKLAVAFAAGLLVWRMGPAGLGVLGTACLFLAFPLRRAWPGGGSVLRGYLLFLVFWTAVKWAVDWLQGAPPLDAVPEALLLGARLGSLLLVGFVLALSTSARQIGLAVNFLLRPVLGRNGWKPALALGLMVHYLPQTWQTVSRVRSTVSLRCPRLFWPRKMLLTGVASIRALGQQTWDQTLAVASRGLDRPEAWREGLFFSPRQWLAGSALIGVLAALSLL